MFRSCTLSPYTTSMKSEADRICPSDGSAALKDGIKDSQLEGSKVCPLSDLYMRSSDSCVRPRCDLEPSIVWLFTWVSEGTRSVKKRPVIQTLPDPVTPKVANNPSLPSTRTPSTKGTTPTPLNMSSWVAPSSNTLVKANFSTALFLESLGG